MKKYLFSFLVFLFILFFILAPTETLDASKNGITLWFEQILPTLLPFTILSGWIINSNFFDLFHGADTKKSHRILPEEWFILLSGFLFGFPIGSKLSSDFYQAGKISKKHAQTLCMFTNHMSPAFVLGYVCTQQLQDIHYALPICLILYAPSLFFALISLLRDSITKRKANEPVDQTQNIDKTNPDEHKNTASSFQLDMKIIDAGIISGFVTLIKLCGYMVFFSIGVSMIQHFSILPQNLKILAISGLEVTNAISFICSHVAEKAKILYLVLISLSFGGLSGLAQTASMISPAGLSVKKYVLTKILLTLLTALLTAAYLSVI